MGTEYNGRLRKRIQLVSFSIWLDCAVIFSYVGVDFVGDAVFSDFLLIIYIVTVSLTAIVIVIVGIKLIIVTFSGNESDSSHKPNHIGNALLTPADTF